MSHEQVTEWLWRAPVIAFILVGGWETLIPRTSLLMPAGRRWLSNFGMWVVLALCNYAFVGSGMLGAAQWAEAQGWGLLRNAWVPYWVQWAVGFLIYDFSSYWLHRASHRFRFLWRLHHVHHSDPDCDLTTALRFHPSEILMAQFSTMALVVLTGPPVTSIFASLLTLTGVSLTTHANVQLPERIDRALGWIFITPDAHHTHHSAIVSHQMGNYAPMFSFWDRMWGTYIQPVREISEYGLPEVDPDKAIHFPSMLLDPFVAEIDDLGASPVTPPQPSRGQS